MAFQGNLLSKTLVIGIIFLLIGMSTIPSIAIDTDKKSSMPFSNGKTLYVGGTGPNNYTKIKDAVDDASDGDTVFVYDDSSPYYEGEIKIDKSIKLSGEDRNTTIVNGQDHYFIVSTATDNITISGFTFKEGYEGVYLSRNNNKIIGNIVCYNKYGIVVNPSGSNCLVQNNKIMYNEKGIRINDGDNEYSDYVFDSNFICHNQWNAISDDERKGLMYYTNNIIADNSYFGWGQTNYAFYKHHSGSVFHHNDVFLNKRNVIAEHPTYRSNKWNDTNGGNYWDDWESNPGYPDTYIVPCTNDIDQIDYKPKATPYFECPVVSIPGDIYSPLDETVYFSAGTNIDSSNLSWFWDFGDGNTSNQKNPTYKYSSTGRYSVNVTVTDDLGRTDTSKSTAIIGSPPSAPIINGPTRVRPRIIIPYSYTFVSTDPDDDKISYEIYWWEDICLYWEHLGPYPSGEEITLDIWLSWPGRIRIIYAYAVDTAGLSSDLASFEVTIIPRNRATIDSLFQLLLDRFPLLEVFLRAMNLLR